ncbi:hypothetical protein X474_11150 [Dethiosulfatarculus sandiegensis]|uniref:Uncharacterized protein n=1 Tax=Dethiosulfatarculus sandiegensis TaxID=1429043 RepID=A0A0D2GFY3_9BACT|nr:hypothetical protein X474_11150 [Dethiosulfatarculus sandiegensis]
MPYEAEFIKQIGHFFIIFISPAQTRPDQPPSPWSGPLAAPKAPPFIVQANPLSIQNKSYNKKTGNAPMRSLFPFPVFFRIISALPGHQKPVKT